MAARFGDVIWSERPDGEIEVATLQEGRLDRYLVHEDGSMTLVESSPPPAGRRWGIPVCLAGALLCAVAIAMYLLSDSRGDGSALQVGLLLAGGVLLVVGASARSRADSLSSRVRKGQDRRRAWHLPTNLHGWEPHSAEQLSAVERIADEHDGLAFVRDDAARAADVVAMRDGRVERYWVDEVGTVGLADSKPRGPRYFVGKVLQAVALILVIASVAVFVFVDGHEVAVFLGFLVVIGAVVLATLLNNRPITLAYRVKQLEGDDAAWREIRTRLPDPD